MVLMGSVCVCGCVRVRVCVCGQRDVIFEGSGLCSSLCCSYDTTGSFTADCFDWWFPRKSLVQMRGMPRTLMILPAIVLFSV